MSYVDAWLGGLVLGDGRRRAMREVILDETGHWHQLVRFRVGDDAVQLVVKSVELRNIPGRAGTLDDVAVLVEGAVNPAPAAGPHRARNDQLVEILLAQEVVSAIERREVAADAVPTVKLAIEYWTQEARTQPFQIEIVLEPKLRRLADVSLELDRPGLALRLPAQSAGGAATHTTLCTLLAQLPPEVRLLKGRLARSDVAVEVAVADAALRALVGNSLRLVAVESDPGLADIAAMVEGERVWRFPVPSLLDVDAPSRLSLALDNGVLNRAFVGVLGARGERGQITVPLEVRRSLELLDEMGVSTTRQQTRHFDLELAWDLSPSVFLELPRVGAVIRLFEPRSGERPVAVPMNLRTEVEPAREPTLHVRLQVVAGRAPERLRLYSRVPSERPPHAADTEAGEAAWHEHGLFELDSAGAGGVPVVADYGIGLGDVFKHAIENDKAAVAFEIGVGREGGAAGDALLLTLVFERPRDSAVLCIDWGTSSIAAGFADDSNNQTQVQPLPLGEVFRAASGRGGRRTAQPAADALDDADDESLIPSHVSLSPKLNFRARSRSFSYNELRVQGTSDIAVKRRLVWLGRSYDIALPADLAAAYRDDDEARIVRDLKRLLAESRDSLTLRAPVLTHEGRTHRISVAKLVLDCLDELRGFYLTEGMRILATSRSSGDSSFEGRLAEALARGDMRLVLTHPCGLSRRLVDRYRAAGESMLARLDRGLFQPLGGYGGASSVAQGVILVPESLAAGYFVLRRAIDERHPVTATRRPLRAVVLDVGAGTFDVSAVDVEWRREGQEPEIGSWRIPLHFGVRVGGHDLDVQLTRLVHAILAELAQQEPSAFAYANHIDDGEARPKAAAAAPGGGAGRLDLERARLAFGTALEQAKRKLSAELFAVADDGHGEGYRWTSQKLRIKLAESGAGGWPLTMREGLSEGPLASLGANDEVQLVCARDERAQQAERTGRAGRAGDGEAPRAPLSLWLEIANIFDRASLNVLGSKLRVQLHDVFRIGELIRHDLPGAAMDWLDALPESEPRPDKTAIVVTGRAALWPPIFEGLRALAAGPDRLLLGDGRRAAPAPLPAREMKEGVMRGAYMLALSRDLLDKPVPPAPLAIRFVPIDRLPDPRSAAGRIVYLDQIVGNGFTGRLSGIDRGSLIQIARVVPGVERIVETGNAVDVQLWSDLLPSPLNPLSLSASRQMPSELEVEVERGPAGDIRVVTLKADWPLRCPISEDGSTFMAAPSPR